LIPRIIEDERGQSALFDAVMFLIVMIIASSLVQIYSSQYSKDVDLLESEDMHAYNRETAETVLGATLNSTWYEDKDGQEFTKPPGDTTVLSLILEELYLMDDGVPKENFVLGYEQDIKILIRNLVTLQCHFSLQGFYKNETKDKGYNIFISDIVPDYATKEEVILDQTDYTALMPRSNLASTRVTMPMIGKSGEVLITFSIWR